MRFLPVNRNALMVELADLDDTLALLASLQRTPVHGVEELVPAAKTILVYFRASATTAASVGWQAGGQSKAVIYLFNTQEALNKFLASDGWSAGADANVALGTIGANGSVDTKTASAPVSGYVLNNAGLEAGVSLSGSKITKVTK